MNAVGYLPSNFDSFDRFSKYEDTACWLGKSPPKAYIALRPIGHILKGDLRMWTLLSANIEKVIVFRKTASLLLVSSSVVRKEQHRSGG